MSVCALVGASEFNKEAFMAMDAASVFDFVIAVDGGYEYMLEIGRRVDMVVGDFDSLGYLPTGVRKATYSPEKDKSDMELAIDHAKRMKQDSIVAFGALGMRLDHTISNLQVFARESERGMSIRAIGALEEVFFVSGPDVVEFEARPSGTISVFSLSEAASGVFIRGLKWEIDDVELSNRTSLGLSNEFIGEASLIGVEQGTIIVTCLL